jgi:alpha-amylase
MKFSPYILLIFSLLSCKKEVEKAPIAPTDLSKIDKKQGLMMQAFYWDVEPRGQWWTTLAGKLEGWKADGITKIWLPPISKGASGGFSMGYDPMDYFDLGEYDQMGTVKTRFGSRQELDALIAKAHSLGMEVIVDIVLNHNSGGQQQYNTFRQKNTYTLFQPKSGRFIRQAEHFHPNNVHAKDAEALFFEEQDLCHDQAYVRKWFWESDSSVAKYYKNTVKIDGWRFDYVKGFDPSVIKSWLAAEGGYSVLEAWDGNADYLKSWVDKTGSPAFDFANFYNMEQAFDQGRLANLNNPALYKMAADKAVTFVTNHDTEKETNQSNRLSTLESKLFAYAYILTHPGYPCMFYLDYETQLPKAQLQNLMLINRTLAKGSHRVLLTTTDVYAAQREGNTNSPGLVMLMNTASASKAVTVTTPWPNSYIYDYTNTLKTSLKTDEKGKVLINIPAKSYLVYSKMKF